jgi:hypothetical protein
MPLKGTLTQAVHDLAGGQDVDWLGYRVIRRNDVLRAAAGERAWINLEERLEEAHYSPEPSLCARAAVQGWVEYLGPCYSRESSPQDCARIRAVAFSLSHEEIQSNREILILWERAHTRWCASLSGEKAR